jgi:hypothetical protein
MSHYAPGAIACRKDRSSPGRSRLSARFTRTWPARFRLKRLAKPLPQEWARGSIDAPFQRLQGSKALKRVQLAGPAASGRNPGLDASRKPQAETTMTTKLGRSLPIPFAKHFACVTSPGSIYTWRNEPAGRLTGREKRPKNNSFSERIVPRPSSDFSTGSSRMTRRSFRSL